MGSARQAAASQPSDYQRQPPQPLSAHPQLPLQQTLAQQPRFTSTRQALYFRRQRRKQPPRQHCLAEQRHTQLRKPHLGCARPAYRSRSRALGNQRQAHGRCRFELAARCAQPARGQSAHQRRFSRAQSAPERPKPADYPAKRAHPNQRAQQRVHRRHRANRPMGRHFFAQQNQPAPHRGHAGRIFTQRQPQNRRGANQLHRIGASAMAAGTRLENQRAQPKHPARQPRHHTAAALCEPIAGRFHALCQPPPMANQPARSV